MTRAILGSTRPAGGETVTHLSNFLSKLCKLQIITWQSSGAAPHQQNLNVWLLETGLTGSTAHAYSVISITI